MNIKASGGESRRSDSGRPLGITLVEITEEEEEEGINGAL